VASVARVACGHPQAAVPHLIVAPYPDRVVLAGRLSRSSPQIRKLLEVLAAQKGDRILVRVVKTTPARQVQHRLNPVEIKELITAYQIGDSVNQLQDRYKISRTTVLEHLKRAGVSRRPDVRKLTDEQAKKAALLYEGGLSLAKVGERFGVDAQTVRRQLQRDGVSIRSRNGWPTP
jgi:DNA invertase Pin-like site-specific DNA recombinase